MAEQMEFKSTIIKRTPANFQEPGGFLDIFLKGFEDILLGNPGPTTNSADEDSRAAMKSLDYILSRGPDYLDPALTPPQFLDWLAGWVGQTLRKGGDFHHADDLLEMENESPSKQLIPLPAYGEGEEPPRPSYNRILISQVVKLYQKRGTLEGIEEFLDFFIDNIAYTVEYLSEGVLKKDTFPVQDLITVEITEYTDELELGRSLLGKNTVLDDSRPYFFLVELKINSSVIELVENVERDIKRIVKEQKPAFTHFVLRTTSDPMKVGDGSQNVLVLGYNSSLGGEVKTEVL